MNKKMAKVGIAIGIFLGAAFVAYAITNLFFTRSQTSDLMKKTIFQFVLSTGLDSVDSSEIGPGDSFSVNPVIYNG